MDSILSDLQRPTILFIGQTEAMTTSTSLSQLVHPMQLLLQRFRPSVPQKRLATVRVYINCKLSGFYAHLIAIDALIVGVETQDRYLGNKKTWTRKIVLLTDGENPIEIEDWEATIDKINALKIRLVIMYVSFCSNL
jgi:hypothetical protein